VSNKQTIWEGKYLAVVKDGTWEYVERRDDIGAAVIVAMDGEHVLLIEQERIPIGRACLELPAGLVGDEDAGESLVDAAARELEEETGYRAESVKNLGEFYSSPGMTSERFSIVRATGLTRTGEPEEGITLHRVPPADLPRFIRDRRAAGIGIDAKLLLLLSLNLLDGNDDLAEIVGVAL
jgi:ADP-ribose pyrophosphatase